ncbi:MAG: VOC family protein [Proteobacteria bacterium]|nr:MAG: VOC family protein [Pseudomonadota bacterium]
MSVALGLKLTHITIDVPSIDEALHFFCTYFGMVVCNDRRKNGGTTVWLSMPQQKIEPLFVLVICEAEEQTYRLDHLGFQVSTLHDFECMHLKMVASPWSTTIVEISDSDLGRYFQISGPGGHGIEITFGQAISGL